jgi:hypothetical protein
MTISHDALTVSEQEAARRQAIRAMRKRLELGKPNPDDYRASDAPRAAQAVAGVLAWAKFGVIPVALAAGVASAIRNVTAVYTNYRAAGTQDTVAILAALAFVVSVEIAVFVVALARAGREMERHAAGRPRYVTSLKSLWRGVRVRLGLETPLPFDELPDRDSLGLVLLLAVGFAVVANLAVAMGPVLANTQQPLQAYLAGLGSAPGSVQIAFVLDVALALLPPALALVGGELTARFAREYAQLAEAGSNEYRADLEAWRAAWVDPLSTDEGADYLAELLDEKARRKAGRQVEREVEPVPFATTATAGAGSNNGNGRQHRAR